MRSIIFIVVFIFASSMAFAGDTWINGYTRKNGTYVPGHYRTNPDKDRSNNYGPARNNRDYDGDGISNRYDRDDDNDGVGDNQDKRQYNSREW